MTTAAATALWLAAESSPSRRRTTSTSTTQPVGRPAAFSVAAGSATSGAARRHPDTPSAMVRPSVCRGTSRTPVRSSSATRRRSCRTAGRQTETQVDCKAPAVDALAGRCRQVRLALLEVFLFLDRPIRVGARELEPGRPAAAATRRRPPPLTGADDDGSIPISFNTAGGSLPLP